MTAPSTAWEAEQMARENARPLSTAKAMCLGAVGLSPAFQRDLEQSNERAEAMNEVWRRLSARG
jgi:hypothetical protein